MEQFVIPQFIDVEDKIIGPITVRQFIIILVGVFVDFIAYKLTDFTFFIVLFFIVLFFIVLFAFIRINGQPFHFFVINFIQTFRRPRLQIWYKETTSINKEKTHIIVASKEQLAPHYLMQSSRLGELALIVDTGGKYRPQS